MKEDNKLIPEIINNDILRLREQHKIDMEEKHILKTCCGNSSDKRLLIFISSLSISIIILLFSCYQLSTSLDCPKQNTYIGLITLLIGLWLKSPIS